MESSRILSSLSPSDRRHSHLQRHLLHRHALRLSSPLNPPSRWPAHLKVPSPPHRRPNSLLLRLRNLVLLRHTQNSRLPLRQRSRQPHPQPSLPQETHERTLLRPRGHLGRTHVLRVRGPRCSQDDEHHGPGALRQPHTHCKQATPFTLLSNPFPSRSRAKARTRTRR